MLGVGIVYCTPAGAKGIGDLIDLFVQLRVFVLKKVLDQSLHQSVVFSERLK